MKTAALIAASVLLLTGCASTIDGDAAGEPSQPPSAQQEAEETTSVAQWAGLVAERQLDTDDWYKKWDDATCSALASSAFDCNTMLLSASFMARTNDIVLSGPSNPDAKTYLGPVPAEIADLYAKTISLTAAAVVAGDAWADADCGIGVEGDCIGMAFDFERAMDAVRTKFAAWSPYL